MGEFLKLPRRRASETGRPAAPGGVKEEVAEPASPLFKECRDLILRKCEPDRQREIRRIFEKEPFESSNGW